MKVQALHIYAIADMCILKIPRQGGLGVVFYFPSNAFTRASTGGWVENKFEIL
jgi:hypothetical protein